MDIKTAIVLFKKRYPDRIVNGYWKDGNDIILNSPIEGIMPGQFVVTDDRDIFSTIPIRRPIILGKKMTKL